MHERPAPREENHPRRLVLRALARLARTPGATSQAMLRVVLDGPDAGGMDPRDRAFVTECFYGVLRWRIRLDAVVSRYARKGIPADPELANLLRLGVFQLLFLDRVPPHAAVCSTVAMARSLRGAKVAGFVNGVLRSVDRDRPQPASLEERFAHPAWMVEHFRDAVGPDRLEARLRANMSPPPVSLRLHPGADVTDLSGARPSDVARGVVVVEGDSDVVRRGIGEGRWLPQDEASARVVELLMPEPGDRVLDICAGRGVKSSQIATAVGQRGEVVAVDASCRRLAAAARLMARWAPETPFRALCADASMDLPLRREALFDRVLVDAPCTGLGVLRRRPETLWTRTPEDVPVLAALQVAILREALRRVRPGGALVYAVCTTTREETIGVTSGLDVEDSFVTAPETSGADAFYAARIRVSV